VEKLKTLKRAEMEREQALAPEEDLIKLQHECVSCALLQRRTVL